MRTTSALVLVVSAVYFLSAEAFVVGGVPPQSSPSAPSTPSARNTRGRRTERAADFGLRLGLRLDDFMDEPLPFQAWASPPLGGAGGSPSTFCRSRGGGGRGDAIELAPPEAPLSPGSHGLLDPEVIGAIMGLVGADDPELRDFFTDFHSSGPMASMHYLGRPGVATRLSALMGEVTAGGAKGGGVSRGAPRVGRWGTYRASSPF